MTGSDSRSGGMKGSETAININPKIYPLDVIYSAAYVFLDEFYVIIDGDPEDKIVVSMIPKTGTNPKDIGKRFNNELVNYAFYKNQVVKNADIRKAIMQRALITTELSQEPKAKRAVSEDVEVAEKFDFSDEDYLEDPEGIAIPWEEKFGKKDGKAEKKK